jgi:hypothetical protein
VLGGGLMLTLLVYLLILLLVLGVIAYVIQTYVPLDPKIKGLAIAIIALIFLLIVIRMLFYSTPLL